MKCEKCGKNEATIYYQETINGQMREAHLCADCAKAMNLGGEPLNAFAGLANGFWGESLPSFFGGSFGSLWNEMAGLPTGARRLQTEKICPTCGMTESDLLRTGRAGCPDCYHAFEEILNPYIQKVHGADSHLGAKPQLEAEAAPESDPAAVLRAKQREAIAGEHYEEAARLRDEIRGLEGDAHV